MRELEKYIDVMKELPRGIEAAEAEAEKTNILSVTVNNGVVGDMTSSQKTGIFIRVKGKSLGMTYTQNVEADPKEMLLEALEISNELQEDEKSNLVLALPSKEDAISLKNFKDAEKTIEHLPVNVLAEKGKEIEVLIRECSTNFSYVSLEIIEYIRTRGITNSLGLEKSFSNKAIEVMVSVTYEGTTHKSIVMEQTVDDISAIDVSYFTNRLHAWLQLPEEKILLDKYDMPAVIDASVMCNIFVAGWQMFSGYDYINKGTPLYGRLGDVIGSKMIQIKDFAKLDGCGYKREFDCQGVDSNNVDLVKDGKLVNLMHNIETASSLDCSSTGNGGRDTNLIQDRLETKVIPTNFTLCSGESSKEDLLATLKDGIYISESYDMFHSVNVASGDFSIPCVGIRYKEGKAVGIIRGLTMSGNIIEMFKNTIDVADDVANYSMVMSKSFQIMSSSILVSNLHISG